MEGHVVPLRGSHSRLLPAGPPRHPVPRSVPRPRAAGLAAAGTVGSWRGTGAPSSSDLGVRGSWPSRFAGDHPSSRVMPARASWPTRVLRRWGTVPRVQAPVGEHVAARHEPERVAPPARPVVRRSSARTLAACPGSTPERPALRPAPPLPRRRGVARRAVASLPPPFRGAHAELLAEPAGEGAGCAETQQL